MALEAILPLITAEIAAQEVVVKKLAVAYDQATAKVDEAAAALTAIQDEMAATADAISAAEDVISDLASMPIEGMMEMEDQIFANTLAQNELNLQLLEMKKAGVNIDDISDSRSSLPHMAPPPEKFISRMRAMGVGDGHQVVVYDALGLFSALARRKSPPRSTISSPVANHGGDGIRTRVRGPMVGTVMEIVEAQGRMSDQGIGNLLTERGH